MFGRNISRLADVTAEIVQHERGRGSARADSFPTSFEHRGLLEASFEEFPWHKPQRASSFRPRMFQCFAAASLFPVASAAGRESSSKVARLRAPCSPPSAIRRSGIAPVIVCANRRDTRVFFVNEGRGKLSPLRVSSRSPIPRQTLICIEFVSSIWNPSNEIPRVFKRENRRASSPWQPISTDF